MTIVHKLYMHSNHVIMIGMHYGNNKVTICNVMQM